jgi:hypothetical protein
MQLVPLHLGRVWRGLFLEAGAGSRAGAGEGKNKNSSKSGKNAAAGAAKTTGMARLADDCQEALGKYLEKLQQRWGAGLDEDNDDEEDEEDKEEPLNLTFDFGGVAAEPEEDKPAAAAGASDKGGKKRQRE